MKIILQREVDNVGLAGDVVDVADGYGRNYLIPRGMAIVATRGAMKQAESLTRSRRAREAQTVDQAEEYREVLESRVLRIPARVDERGHLYGSVSAGDVHRVLRERGHDIERRRVDMRGTLKEIGTYEVGVQVHPQVVATVQVEVVDEEGRVTLTSGGIEAEVDEGEVADAVADAAEGSESDVDALAEQALEAARAYEAEQAARAAAGEDTTEPGADEGPAGEDTDEGQPAG